MTKPGGSPVGQVREILAGVAWVGVGHLAGRLMGFVGTIVGARLLGVSGFGAFSFVQSTVSVVNAYAGMGVGTTAVRFVAAGAGDEAAAKATSVRLTRIGFACALIAAAVVAAAAPWIAGSLLGRPELTFALRIAAFLVLGGIAWETVQGILSGYRRFSRLALCAVVAGIGALAGIVILTPFFGLPGFIVGQALGSLAAVGVGMAMLLRDWREPAAGGGVEGERLPAMMRFGLIFVGSNAVLTPAIWYVVWRLAANPAGLESVGQWGAAHQLRNIIALLPGLVSQVALPFLAYQSGRGQTSEFQATLRTSVLISGSAVLLPGILLMLLIEPMLGIFGADFRGGALLASGVIAGGIIHMFSAPVVHALTVNNVGLTALVNVLWAVVLIATFLGLLPVSGAISAGIAWFTAYVVSMLLAATLVSRQDNIDSRTLLDVAVVLLTCAAALGGLLISQIWIAWCSAGVAVVFTFRWVTELRAAPAKA